MRFASSADLDTAAVAACVNPFFENCKISLPFAAAAARKAISFNPPPAGNKPMPTSTKPM